MASKKEEELKEWISKELLVSGEREVLLQALNEIKEKVKNYVKLSQEERKIILLPIVQKLSERWKIYMYFVGKAYAHIIGIFDEDNVNNEELSAALNIPRDSINARLKELRDQGFIIQLKRGNHRINYSRVKDAFNELESREKTNEQ